MDDSPAFPRRCPIYTIPIMDAYSLPQASVDVAQSQSICFGNHNMKDDDVSSGRSSAEIGYQTEYSLCIKRLLDSTGALTPGSKPMVIFSSFVPSPSIG